MIHHEDLVVGLEPIRQMFRAQAVQVLLSTGIAETLAQRDTAVGLEELKAVGNFDATRLQAFLEYCVHESLIQESVGIGYFPTETLRRLLVLAPWYEMLVAGYGQSFPALPELLADPARYAPRHLSEVARGSSGISRHDSIPVILDLLEAHNISAPITDLGSADGAYLQAIAEARGSCPMTAVEPNEDSAVRAKRALSLYPEARVVVDTAQSYVDGLEEPRGCFIISFVLHEILAQDGEEYVEGFLSRLLSHPDNTLIVTEVNRDVAPGTLEQGIGLNYYNPYFLLHAITRQRLLGLKDWTRIIQNAGGVITDTRHPDDRLDPTLTEFVALVRPNQTSEPTLR